MNSIRDYLSNATFDGAIELLVAAAVIILVSRYAQRRTARAMSDVADRRRIRRAIAVGSYILIALAAALIFSDRLGTLSVYFGVITVGIAFALQSIIANVAAWLVNATGAYYRIGDRIQLGDVTGDVIDINVMVTTMMEIGDWVKADLYTGRIVRVSNSSIFTAPVFNYSGDFPFLWDEISVPIKYGSDRQLACEILARVATEVTLDSIDQARSTWANVAEKYAVEPATVEPLVTVAATDNWLEYTVRFVTSYQTRRATKSQLFTRILDEFDEVSDRLSIASGTYDIVGLPALNVHIDHSADRL